MKRLLYALLLIALFIGVTAGAVIVSVNTVSDFAKEKNIEKTALVQQRLDETINLLKALSVDEYICSEDVSYEDKAVFLTNKNKNEGLGYMMVRILDENIIIYREESGAAADLSSRDYMQRMYATGEGQVTDAFLAGADGKTINYTVTEAIIEDGKVIGSLMAAIYGSQIDEFLYDEDSENVLVGSLLQYMSGSTEQQYGLAVAQVLESERSTLRPVENIILDFYEKRSGEFWSIGDGIRYSTYSPVQHADWVVMTEVRALPLVKNIIIIYICCLAALVVCAFFMFRRRPTPHNYFR